MHDRQRADREIVKEEAFVEETNILKISCANATADAQKARSRMEGATAALDSLDDSLGISDILDGNDISPRKKEKQLQDKRRCSMKVKETSAENAAAEMIRRHAQCAYDEALQRAKIQSDRAAQAVKQAEQSAAIADRMAEHAEEERAAAELRKTANMRADKSLEKSEQEFRSAEAQYHQAQVACEESERLARKSSEKADELTEAVILSKMLTTERISFLSEKEKVLKLKQDRYNDMDNEYKEVEKQLKVAEGSLSASMDMYVQNEIEHSQGEQKGQTQIMFLSNVFNATKTAIQAKARAQEGKHLAEEANKVVSDEMAVHNNKITKIEKKHDASLPIAPSFSRLVLLSSHKFKGWEKSKILPNSELLCINDMNASTLARRSAADRKSWIDFNCNHISRVFPTSGLNSNLNPIIPWSLGCQIVPVNSQIFDAELMLNDGRFRENGSCGYVLKNGRLTNPEKYKDVSTERPRSVRFRVLNGYNINQSYKRKGKVVQPYVNIAVCDGITGKISTCKTGAVKGNGLNPQWNEEIPAMFNVETPSLAMVLFSVWDKRTDTFLSSSSMPFRCIKQGYRSVSLFNEYNCRTGLSSSSSLLIEVKFDQR